MNELLEKCLEIHQYCTDASGTERGLPGDPGPIGPPGHEGVRGAPGKIGLMGVPGKIYITFKSVILHSSRTSRPCWSSR